MTTRAAIIGCGDISALHAEVLKGLVGAQLVAVCDTDAAAAAAACDRWKVPAFATAEELFRVARPDVVHVCTPHATHAGIAISALEHGIHVLLEKPIARDPMQARAVVEAAHRSPAKIAICFQNRYNTPVQAAYDMLRSGRFGRVLGGAGTVIWHRTAEYYAASGWRGTWSGSGGGLLMNQAIHTLDLLLWLMGPATSVAGSAATRALPIEVEDTAELTLTHVGGARSVFYATNLHAANEPVVVDIVTQKAHFRIGDELTVTHDDGTVERTAEQTLRDGARSYWGVSHERLITDFYARLAEPEPFWITPEDGARAVEVIHDVYATSFPDAVAALSPETKRSTTP